MIYFNDNDNKAYHYLERHRRKLMRKARKHHKSFMDKVREVIKWTRI